MKNITKKKNTRNGVLRLLITILAFLLQIIWLVTIFIRLNEYSVLISTLTSVMALLVAIRIYSDTSNSTFKQMWLMTLLVFPILGLLLYLLYGNKNATKRKKVTFAKVHNSLNEHVVQSEDVLEEMEKIDKGISNQFRYLIKNGYPVYQQTDVEFYAEAKDGFEAQLETMQKAKHFIFMDYHAVEEAEAFEKMLDILKEKVSQGVKVRILYDDVGSIGFTNLRLVKRLKALGIQCKAFNPVSPFFQIFMNNRDHRKIMVVDGEVGFTGGYNIADEYFNIVNPYGYWKDTGVKLEGEAVKNLTAMFLEMWNVNGLKDDDVKYLEQYHKETQNKTGFVQPYADDPLNDLDIAENVYLNLIKNAKDYFYATTPYLIIGDEMKRELTLAAERGVDVRIITPGIPDKKFIYRATRSYYAELVRYGVRIYEYTPGFVHAKQTIADGEVATVGTINFDYRSLYHHFENGVLLYGYDAIKKIEKDFQQVIDDSREVTELYKNKSTILRGVDSFLRWVSPLL